MLWPIVLPFQITCVLLFCFIVASTIFAPIFAPRMKRRRVSVGAWSLLLSFFAFVPACIGIQTALAPIRFGEFQYVDFRSVGDRRVQRYLPGPATSITMQKHQHGNGFDARFVVTKGALDVWFQQHWDAHVARDANVAGDRDVPKIVSREQCEYQFSKRSDWPLPDSPTEIWQYEGPRRPNGAGTTIWFDAKNGVAYQTAGYW